MTRPARRAGWLIRTAWPPLLWLLAAVVMLLRGLVVEVDGWLPVHLVLLGAVSNVVLVWTAHFTNAVLRRPSDDRPAQARRIVAFNVGALLVVAGAVLESVPLLSTGALVVVLAVAAHAIWLARALRSSLPARFARTVRFYIAAASLLVLGIGAGVALEAGVGDDEIEPRLVVVHLTLNLLGWLALTVLGTLITLWPTMLRTPMGDAVEVAQLAALPWLVIAVIGSAAAALADLRIIAALVLVGFLAVAARLTSPFVSQLRAKPPREVATWSVLAGVLWFVLGTAGLAVVELVGPDWEAVDDRLGRHVLPCLIVGFAVQVVVGALCYLVPVMLGGGPAAVRASIQQVAALGRSRVALLNLGVLVVVLAPGAGRTLGLLVAGVAVVADVAVLALTAVRASRRTASPGAAAIP